MMTVTTVAGCHGQCKGQCGIQELHKLPPFRSTFFITAIHRPKGPGKKIHTHGSAATGVYCIYDKNWDKWHFCDSLSIKPN
jgi:hypothetical protein